MKNLLIVFFVFLLFACQKSYTCECTITTDWNEYNDSVPRIYNRTIIVSDKVKGTKKKAQHLCSVGNATASTISYSISGSFITTTVTTTQCQIK